MDVVVYPTAVLHLTSGVDKQDNRQKTSECRILPELGLFQLLYALTEFDSVINLGIHQMLEDGMSMKITTTVNFQGLSDLVIEGEVFLYFRNILPTI